MSGEMVIPVLLGIITFQQIFFLKQIHKLVDKLMSRSYTEYIKADKPEMPKAQFPMEIGEDLSTVPQLNF